MTSKIIATNAYLMGAETIKPINPPRYRNQRGVTLMELMVGLAIGLMVVAVAMGGLMISRTINGTVTDAGTIQQQAAYALRMIGLQLRQSGSLRLTSAISGTNEELAPMIFEIKNGNFDISTSEGQKLILQGKDSPGSGEYKLTTGYAGYTEPSFLSGAIEFRDCLGQGPTNSLLLSQFVLDSSAYELKCAGAAASGSQAVLSNVADFQVRYIQQTVPGSGNPLLQYVNATTVGTNWAQVRGVEVCLTLFGAEPIDVPAGSTYTSCDGQSVDMTTLTDGKRKRRLHLTFRNVFQLRSQGLIGSAL